MKHHALILVLLLACSRGGDPRPLLADELGLALMTACPFGDDPRDEVARDRCADSLADLPVLKRAMVEPFIWGGQRDGYALENGTNKFNPRVWRRLYLSTFMFGSAFTSECVGTDTILHVPVRFRGELPPGEYPYPFWHAEKKWDAYNRATTIHFVIRGDRIVGALRSVEQDRTRPVEPLLWDGLWRWDHGAEPRVALYDYLFSSGNPFVRPLDAAYRELEVELRRHNCQTCHAPDNRGGSEQLEFFVYPAQALAGRHDIVAQLEDDTMPPLNDLGIAPGIADDRERQELITRARAFGSVGDAALAWEDAFR